MGEGERGTSSDKVRVSVVVSSDSIPGLCLFWRQFSIVVGETPTGDRSVGWGTAFKDCLGEESDARGGSISQEAAYADSALAESRRSTGGGGGE